MKNKKKIKLKNSKKIARPEFNPLDIIGKVSGDFRVISLESQHSNGEYFYNCECIHCGASIIKRRFVIVNNKCGNCKCQNVEKMKKKYVGNVYKTIKVLDLDHIEKPINHDNKYFFKCHCLLCGRDFVLESRYLGVYESCGCREGNIKHGMNGTRFYAIHHDMVTRCCNPNSKAYNNYGGRGIKVCDRWLGESGFIHFKEDMYDSYLKRAEECGGEQYISIDRKDVNGDYCKENCRWATRKEQANNVRTNHIVYYNGEELSLAEAVDKYAIDGLDYNTIKKRIYAGWSIEEALRTPITIGQTYEYNGESLTMQDLVDKYGDCRLTKDVIRSRIQKYGWDIDRALHELPKFKNGKPIICPISFREPDNITPNFLNNNCIEP